jgi:hypothetical protein
VGIGEHASFLSIMVIQSQLLIRIIKKSGFLISPKIIRVPSLAIAQEIIAPEKERV